MLAYVGIGSNLGDRAANAERALREMAAIGSVTRISSFYRTAPWGNPDQPWYLNAVAGVETTLPPRTLLERLRAIEETMGRVREEKRWGPRTIDLDLLLYEDFEIAEPELCVPHPHLRERAFVLVPLAEVDERFAILRDALAESELAGVARIERESTTEMPGQPLLSVTERIAALARFLSESDAVRVRVERGYDAIEISTAGRRPANAGAPGGGQSESGSTRVETIKADLVGIFHLSRPAPADGETIDGDRELGYIEALGIRTPVHSTGGGRIVSVAATDGAPVEYGQPLFLISRGR